MEVKLKESGFIFKKYNVILKTNKKDWTIVSDMIDKKSAMNIAAGVRATLEILKHENVI